jgi:hypothetical protein
MQARVVSINTESGRPLQSAAKVPIMVTFTVRMDGNTTSAERSTEDTAATTTVPQALIFKVGDDCRQDVLALQVNLPTATDVCVCEASAQTKLPACNRTHVPRNLISLYTNDGIDFKCPYSNRPLKPLTPSIGLWLGVFRSIQESQTLSLVNLIST